jgi:hypothetical protein
LGGGLLQRSQGPEPAAALTTGTHMCRTSAPVDHVAVYARGRVSPNYAER